MNVSLLFSQNWDQKISKKNCLSKNTQFYQIKVECAIYQSPTLELKKGNSNFEVIDSGNKKFSQLSRHPQK
jgi:hypothetical protein